GPQNEKAKQPEPSSVPLKGSTLPHLLPSHCQNYARPIYTSRLARFAWCTSRIALAIRSSSLRLRLTYFLRLGLAAFSFMSGDARCGKICCRAYVVSQTF